MKLEIADLATDEKKRLHGFKVLGVFPFYLKFIRVPVHVKLCKIREQIKKAAPNEAKMQDFYDYKVQEAITPLIIEYCTEALVNNRPFAFLFKLLLRRKIKACGHYHILNLYFTIQKFNEPAFFLAYYKLMKAEDGTLLKEAKLF